MSFLQITQTQRLRRLQPPVGRIRMVLDTDTANEIDDQFAVVYSLLSSQRLEVEAFYAAPFHNRRSSGPADGMERSYAELLRLLHKMGTEPDGRVLRGSTGYLDDPAAPRESAAAADLIERATVDDASPLYVVAIGAITNVASAILMEPAITESIIVVWLGGHARHWPDTKEFNLRQDVHAARLIFDCGVPLVHIPCNGVTTHLHTTLPEMAMYLAGRGCIGDYLLHLFEAYYEDHYGRSKVLWDMATIGYLVDERWVPSELVSSPVVTDQLTWHFDPSRHLVRSAYMVNRDEILADFFTKLSGLSVGE